MTLAIIQARLKSSRLPRKIYEDISGSRMIDWVIDGVSRSSVDSIVVASSCPLDVSVPVYVGSESDVLDRFYQCAKKEKADTIVRITADCPLIDPKIIDFALEYFKANPYPYIYIAPIDGLDVEVFSMDLLEEAWKNSRDKDDREHVTPYMKRKTKLSVDTIEDLEKVRGWVSDLGK